MTKLMLVLFFSGAFVVPAAAQVTCTVLGHFTTCSSATDSTIQADLAPNRGVIIGRERTEPYTILSPTPRTDRSSTPLFVPSSSSAEFQTPSTGYALPPSAYGLPSEPGMLGY